ncbi:expressed unknown protein [Seminavis robusta]|uniref:Uncharacterized protein n=1 Tax=Seminavis robusta TaxID=568900 RepID=A0A9N8DKY8_9STRA|nr:expressed unknown protein [Seminavis robusta]|eukprot:Sro142_g066110.1 n/a (584) ;mRNA; f:22500-24251
MAQPLSISTGDDHDETQALQQQDDDDTTSNNNEPSLEQKILEVVKKCPKDESQQYLVKPARLSAELGLSVEDATAELCGLLQAVGGGHDGAEFRFETTKDDTNSSTGVSTMVFTFPLDFERRAKRKRRKEDFQQWLWECFLVFLKGLKIVTAFGLILSLCILVIAAMIGIVVAIVAMSTNNQRGNGAHRHMLFRQLRAMFYTVRQLLWCYALFGQSVEGQDPFLGEMAYDMSLLLSVCCGSPGSFFWWFRMQQLNRRREMQRRGWRRGLWNQSSGGQYEMESDVSGVRLVRGGDWARQQQQLQQPVQQGSSDEQRGLLSIAVEYLFGPTPFAPGPSETEKWKLRAAAIVQLASNHQGVSLQQLSPYTDEPPSSVDQDVTALVAGGLQIVTHFNGVPAKTTTEMKPHMAQFSFPELMGESQYAARYENLADDEDADDESWGSLLCVGATGLGRPSRRTGATASPVPTHLTERRYKFTKLQTNQFVYCVSLGALNLVGVIWLKQSLEPKGMLFIPDGTLMATIIKHGLMKVLYFYAILFFVLPAARLALIALLNARIRKRNSRRKGLASSLNVSSSVPAQVSSPL